MLFLLINTLITSLKITHVELNIHLCAEDIEKSSVHAHHRQQPDGCQRNQEKTKIRRNISHQKDMKY